MIYFSRRNKYVTEYSGHEEVSLGLRRRIQNVVTRYVENNDSFHNDDPWYIEPDDFMHEVRKEFPESRPSVLLEQGEFHHVFTVVEIFLDLVSHLHYTQNTLAPEEMSRAFDLSGSVYAIKNNRVTLRIDTDLADKIRDAEELFSPYDK